MSDEAQAAPADAPAAVPAGKESASAFANRILEETKARAGALFDSLSKKERKELEEAAADMAELQLASLLGEDVSAEIPLVAARIKNLTVAGQVRIMRHLRDSLSSVVQDAVTFALKVIPSA